MPTSRLQGKVKMWSVDRGFGFVRRDDSGDDVFCHVTKLPDGMDELATGTRLEFEIETNPKTGKPQAVNVELI